MSNCPVKGKIRCNLDLVAIDDFQGKTNSTLYLNGDAKSMNQNHDTMLWNYRTDISGGSKVTKGPY